MSCHGWFQNTNNVMVKMLSSRLPISIFLNIGWLSEKKDSPDSQIFQLLHGDPEATLKYISLHPVPDLPLRLLLHPSNVKKQQLYSELNVWAPRPILKGEPRHLKEETHFLYSLPFFCLLLKVHEHRGVLERRSKVCLWLCFLFNILLSHITANTDLPGNLTLQFSAS